MRSHCNGVYKLRKAIYGLWQARQKWCLGLSPMAADPCVYYGNRENQKVYIDGMLIISPYHQWIKEIENDLRKEFHIKDLEPVWHCLGFEIH